jgi:hypothetical protein
MAKASNGAVVARLDFADKFDREVIGKSVGCRLFKEEFWL